VPFPSETDGIVPPRIGWGIFRDSGSPNLRQSRRLPRAESQILTLAPSCPSNFTSSLTRLPGQEGYAYGTRSVAEMENRNQSNGKGRTLSKMTARRKSRGEAKRRPRDTIWVFGDESYDEERFVYAFWIANGDCGELRELLPKMRKWLRAQQAEIGLDTVARLNNEPKDYALGRYRPPQRVPRVRRVLPWMQETILLKEAIQDDPQLVGVAFHVLQSETHGPTAELYAQVIKKLGQFLQVSGNGIPPHGAVRVVMDTFPFRRREPVLEAWAALRVSDPAPWLGHSDKSRRCWRRTGWLVLFGGYDQGAIHGHGKPESGSPKFGCEISRKKGRIRSRPSVPAWMRALYVADSRRSPEAAPRLP
jgi:hypothetical protein